MAFDLTAFKDDPVYRTVGSFSEIERDIHQIQEIDKLGEQRQTIGVVWAMVGLFVGVGGFTFVYGGFGVPGIVLGIIGGSVFCFGFYYRMLAGRLNFEDYRYDFLSQILHLLKIDMPVDSQFDVMLDCNSATDSRKFVREGVVGRWNAKYYEDDWMMVTGKFKDGTSFKVQICELTQLRSRWAVSRSGKSKYKTKSKKSTTVYVQLRPKAEKYPNLHQNASQLMAEMRVPEWTQLKWARPTPKGLEAKLVSKVPWEVGSIGGSMDSGSLEGHQMVMMLFMSMYRVLNKSKAVSI